MVNWLIGIPVVLVLASGTFSAIANKALYDFKSQGSCGYHGFEKPYFLTFAMFCGEAMCLLAFHAQEWWKKDSSKEWVSGHCWPAIYTFDPEQERIRRRKEWEAQQHGIEVVRDDQRLMSDEEEDEEDEEKSLLHSRSNTTERNVTDGAPRRPSLVRPAPYHRRVNHSGSDNGLELDPDLAALHLSAPELEQRREAQKPSKFVYLGLCMFDLSASALGGVGLMYIDASSNQMLRGSMVVFTAIFSRILLRRRLSWKQWAGIMSVVAGLALVGMCGLFRANALLTNQQTTQALSNYVSPSHALLGLFLVLSGAALNSIQNVFEEILVKRVGGDAIDSLELVGWEGVWGTLITGLVLLPTVNAIPGPNCGRAESIVDTWTLMRGSSLIVALVIGYTIALAMMNAFSVELSKAVSATFRQLINALRVVFIWAISILLFYVWSHRTMGEGWDVYSYMQLGGFALLIVGTLLYGTKESTEGDPSALEVDVDGLNRDDDEDAKKKPNGSLVDMQDEDGIDDDDDGEDEHDTKSKSKSHPIHIGKGRSKSHGRRPIARSPGIETVALRSNLDDEPDFDGNPATAITNNGEPSPDSETPPSPQITSRRHGPSIRIEDEEDVAAASSFKAPDLDQILH